MSLGIKAISIQCASCFAEPETYCMTVSGYAQPRFCQTRLDEASRMTRDANARRRVVEK